jgi:hypothetical protein
MKFIYKDYNHKIEKTLFQKDKSKRVTFNAFFAFLEENAIHEFTPE